jgi:hypothetical protein
LKFDAGGRRPDAGSFGPGGADDGEKTPNSLLDAEADRLCRAKRYERSLDQADIQAGHYERRLALRPPPTLVEATVLTLIVAECRQLPKWRPRKSTQSGLVFFVQCFTNMGPKLQADCFLGFSGCNVRMYPWSFSKVD